MPNPVVHFEVAGKDADALQRFYADAFGWKMQPAIPGYAMALPGEEGGINGGVGVAEEGQPGHVTFYVQVPDLERALSKVESLGGKRVGQIMDIPEGPTIGMFADPEGHLIGLVKAGTS